MAQTYTTQGTITKATVARSYVDALQVNSDTLRSNFSGAAFPDNPVEGQHCYRTDKALEYIYKSGGWTVNDDGTPTNAEVITARGSLASLNTRLDVSMNADGTLKNPATATIDEWKDNALVVTYVSATSFSVPEDVTSIFTASRKIKAVLGTTSVITSVAASSYDSTNAKTVVTVNDAVLTSKLSAVKYSIVQYGVPSNCDKTALTNHDASTSAHSNLLANSTFGNAVISHLLGTTLASVVTAVSSGSLFGKMVKLLLDATGVKYLMAQNGYVCLGSLFGGLILQWGTGSHGVSTTTEDIFFPIDFPHAGFIINASDTDNVNIIGATIKSSKYFTIYANNTGFQWLCLGY